jgi:endonuclease-3 related protein
VPRTPIERFQVILGAVLTQNTTWSNAEKALRALMKAGVGTAPALMGCPPKKIALLIKPSGYFNQKTRKLMSLCSLLSARGFLSAKRPPSRESLLSIWGIGPETADSILLYAFKLPFFVVDAYTRRLLARLDLIEGREGYLEIQGMFHNALKRDHELFNEYHALVVEHAKRFCRARPVCGNCPLGDVCLKGKPPRRPTKCPGFATAPNRRRSSPPPKT